MAEMAVILSDLAISNEGDAHGLLFIASPLALKSKQIYNIWHIRWIKPCQLLGWMENSP